MDMTPQKELVMRAMTLHRRAWLSKVGTGEALGIANSPVVVGDVTISRTSGKWIIELWEGDKSACVYWESEDSKVPCSVKKTQTNKALQILRTAMILDDLSRI